MAQEFAAVMFDLDGTLADTERLKALAHAETIDHFGGPGNPELYKQVVGRPFRDVMTFLCAAADISPDPRDYEHNYRRTYAGLLPRASPMPGAVELVQRTAGTTRLAVVSSSTGEIVRRVLDAIRLRALIDVVVSADDVSKEKPDPEPYLVATRALEVRPEDALVFEDSEAGVKSAVAAGATVIAVRHDFNREQDLTLASLEVSSLLDGAALRGLTR